MSRTARYRVIGMACDNCVDLITAELSTIEGIGVHVDLDTETLTVSCDAEPDDAEILAAVDEAGYAATRITDR